MKDKSCEHRMYLIIREDLSFKYVQGSHALAQFSLEHPELFKQWNNETIIFLSTFNGLTLEDIQLNTLCEMKLGEIGGTIAETCVPKFDYSAFYEPDLKSPLPTAICVYEDGKGDVKEALSKLKMATK